MNIIREILCTLGLHIHRDWTDEGPFYSRPGDILLTGRMYVGKCTHCGQPKAKVVKP